MNRRIFCKSVATVLLAMGLNPKLVLADERSKVLLGAVKVNNKSKKGYLDNLKSSILETQDQQTVVKVKDDVFLIRPFSKVKFVSNKIVEVIQGSVHAAFSKQPKELKIKTTQGTIGIRGTVTYIEVESKFNRTYVCNCYGHTNLYNNKNQLIKSLQSDYHNPAIITASGLAEKSPYNIPLNHFDDHIETLEQQAGRSPRWKLPKGKKIFISPTSLKLNF